MAVYKVKTPTGDRYVEAASKAAAINWCIDKKDYSAEPLTASETVKYAKEGVSFENALPTEKAKAA